MRRYVAMVLIIPYVIWITLLAAGGWGCASCIKVCFRGPKAGHEFYPASNNILAGVRQPCGAGAHQILEVRVLFQWSALPAAEIHLCLLLLGQEQPTEGDYAPGRPLKPSRIAAAAWCFVTLFRSSRT